MVTQKTKVKRAFNDRGVQVTGDALEFIDGLFNEIIRDMAIEAENRGIKRVNGNGDLRGLIGSAIKARSEEKKCDRCVGLRDDFLKFARQLQQFVADEAKIMLKKGGFVK